ARYNLGAVQFERAKSMTEKDPSGALELLRKSERSFRGALDIDASDGTAAKNIEAVQLAAKGIIERLRKQEEQKQQDQQQKQSQNQQSGAGDQKQDRQGSDKQQDQKEQHDPDGQK